MNPVPAAALAGSEWLLEAPVFGHYAPPMHPSGPPPGAPPGPPPGGPPQQPPHGYAPPGGGYPPQQAPRPSAPSAPWTAEQKLAIAFGVCALAVLVTMLSKSWIRIDDEGGLGPSGLEECRRGMCIGVPWEPVSEHIGSDIPVFATLGMIAGILAAVALGAAGVMLFLKKNMAKFPLQPTRIALGLAAFGSTFMTMRILTNDRVGDEASIGWAAIVGIAALVTAGVFLQKLGPIIAQAKGAAPVGTPQLGAGGPGPYGHAQPGHGHPPQHGYGQPQHGQPAQPMSPQQMGTAPTMASAPQAAAAPTYPCPRCQKSLVFVAQYQRWFCESCRQYA
jgi:hypothetical protein